MTKIYRESFGYFLSSLLVLLLVAFFLEAMLWFLQPSSQMSVSFVALTFIAYGFHRHFLFGETLHLTKQTIARGAPPQKFGWFILVSGALVLIPVVVAVTLAFQYSSDRDAHSTEDGHRFHGIAGTHSTASRAADLTDGFMESGLC
jgi:hypothetical protein